jgi:hypothetical protein
MSHRNKVSPVALCGIQLFIAAAFALSWFLLPSSDRHRIQAELIAERPMADVQISNTVPVAPQPLYDDPEVISEEDLALVLHAILPRFSQQKLKPNFVEHALRAWGSEIEFTNEELISGPQMTDYLLDTGSYIASWGTDSDPILQPNSDSGIYVRWASDSSASVHHDHLLASLAEAGVTLERAVYTPARQTTLHEIFAESLRDFRLDERETEWSVMAFASYLAPQHTKVWKNSQGREISFDMMATRLMRSHKQKGVCLGIHRVYSLIMLVQLDEEYGNLISASMRDEIMEFLADIRQLIIDAQHEDGSWPPNWADGIQAEANRDPDEELYRRVIATGHHLEWLAIAPLELHPPREDIIRAARWIVQNVRDTPQDGIESKYTFYSHVGNALALWRQTSPAEFWQTWRESHPDAELFPEHEADTESE